MAITKVVMPKLSEAMETGKVLKWLKREGDKVEGGEIIAEIETDKADIELEAFGSGVLRKILVPAGERAPVGELIAVVAAPDDDLSQVTSAGERPEAAIGAKSPAASPKPPEAPAPSRTQPTVAPAPQVGAAPARERLKASPLARKIAQASGVDLGVVQGTGPGGRIIRRDIERYAAVPTAPRDRRVGGPEFEDLPLSSLRAAIAKQMAQAKAVAPHFYLTSEIAMDRASALREELNELAERPKISFTDLIVRAAALALAIHPEVNASFQGDAIRVHHRVHIGIAVALEEGLITPVLRDAAAKSLHEIARETRDLAERARNRKLRSQELSGATFTISNLGMYEIDEFIAIINPPEGAILAVGSVVEKPVAVNGRIEVGRRMRVTLSCDHRVMDGAMGARFLQDLRRLLEAPSRLLM
ncbi:MAG TPA: dihydrolipoamide acetyltransferase family protein [Methylomirabilota bacterium]|nr:dihydrolipoamide acetyltransferase family protein [Methylomirabilota bacterium]